MWATLIAAENSPEFSTAFKVSHKILGVLCPANKQNELKDKKGFAPYLFGKAN